MMLSIDLMIIVDAGRDPSNHRWWWI